MIDTTIDLEPNTTYRFNRQLRMNEQYRITVDVQGGPNETYEWNDVGSPLHVIVDDSENVVFATQVG